MRKISSLSSKLLRRRQLFNRIIQFYLPLWHIFSTITLSFFGEAPTHRMKVIIKCSEIHSTEFAAASVSNVVSSSVCSAWITFNLKILIFDWKWIRVGKAGANVKNKDLKAFRAFLSTRKIYFGWKNILCHGLTELLSFRFELFIAIYNSVFF